MFQTFDDVNDPTRGAERLALLRGELARRGLDGFLVPLSDEHQGEYIPASARRLAWLTGFGGSAGIAVVFLDRAAIFVDGRYTVQVREQVDTAVFEPLHLIEEPPHLWVQGRIAAGARLGYDPWLMTLAEVERYGRAVAAAGASLVAVGDNPVDAVWTDRPAPPKGAVRLHPDELAGESAASKIARVARAVAEAGVDAAVITRPESIAWLLNIRGADVPHTPQAQSFAILPAGGRPALFIDGDKLGNIERSTIEEAADVRSPAEFVPALAALAGPVLVDRSSAAAAIAQTIEAGGGRIVDGPDPVSLPKARKNAAELSGSRAAHIRDGAAMVRFLAFVDREAPKGRLTEKSAAEALERFRADTGLLRDLSFDTISGAGPHAALPHYRVTTASDRAIGLNELYLVDSGAQYEDGTTDITRTVIVGTPSAEMIDRFTRVLRGHIRLSLATFPAGTTGAHLDVLARQPLWEAGLDFDHGTGHGVGAYLSVHEGPARISKTGHVPLEPGMILSNEPGYYKEGHFGIRIENLVVVTEPRPLPGGERPMMAFETISFCPIDRRLIDPRLLLADERLWLDRYHAEVRSRLAPFVPEGEPRRWLIAATEPL